MDTADAQPAARSPRRIPLEVKCTLPADEAADQFGEWTELRQEATDVKTGNGTVRLSFPIALEPVVTNLVARESACCSFLQMLVEVDGDGCHLTMTADTPDGRIVVAALTGGDSS